MVKVAWVQGEGSCPSGDWGPGCWLCAQVGGCGPSWHNHASSHGWEGPGTRLGGLYKSGLRRRRRAQVPTARTAQARQSPGSHCQLPSTLRCPPQECTTLESGYVIQETFHVFLGVFSGNAAGTAIHAAGRILGWLPGLTSHPASCVLGPAGLWLCSATCLGK